MTSDNKKKIKAERPRGFEDLSGEDLLLLEKITSTIEKTYKFYGFEKLETSIVELSNVIGSFLPDQDRPNEGVFSLEDDDSRWLSLRYDLTSLNPIEDINLVGFLEMKNQVQVDSVNSCKWMLIQ